MMGPIDHLLADLADALPDAADAADEREVPLPGGVPALEMTHLELAVPIEASIASDGALHATLPRGVMATGFGLPHGRIAARFERAGR
jgi:hypothetical protein